MLGDPTVNGEIGLLRVTGLNTVGIPSFLNQYLFQNNYQMMDDLSWTHGQHAMKFGASVRRFRSTAAISTTDFVGNSPSTASPIFSRAGPRSIRAMKATLGSDSPDGISVLRAGRLANHSDFDL